ALETLRADCGRVAGSRVCVLAGPGNNAGDALFAAAALAGRGAAVSVITLFDRTHAEGLAAACRSGAQVVSFTAAGPAEATPAGAPAAAPATDSARDEALRELTRADLVLDGILGTGGRRRSEEHTSELQSRFDLVCRLLLEKT